MASDSENDTPPPAKTSVTMWFLFMIVFTLVAGGGGAAFGLYLVSQTKIVLAANAKEAADAQTPAALKNIGIRELPPVITNLGQNSDTWVRLHAAIVFDSVAVETPDVLAADIASDILGFMQTLSISQFSGASGLQHLREDLNDRAIVRSDGRVRELMIESLVVQ